MWLFPLIRKTDVFLEFSKFKILIENLLSLSIKMVQIDGGGEFVNKNLQSLFQKCGILHCLTWHNKMVFLNGNIGTLLKKQDVY